MFAAAALISLLLAACPLPMGPDWQKVVFVPTVDIPFGADAVVAGYNLQAYVPVPTAGAAPVQTNTARGDVDIAVVWKDAAGQVLGEAFDQFALGAVYQAEITLTAKNGYGFNPGIRFRYQPEEAVAAQPADNFSSGVRSLSTVTYLPAGEGMTIAGPIDLTALVPAPVMGATPVTSFYAGTYGGTVAWKSGGVETAGLFKAVTTYGAEVSLYPAVGYVFPAGLTVTHSGAAVAASFTRGAGTAAGGLSFPATTTVAAVVVNDLDLSYKVPAPVRGGTPVEYFSTPQYTGWVDWLVGGTTAPHSVFQTNMAYTAKVTVTAASGYTLGNPAVSFTHGSAGTITADNGNGTLTVTAAFPATTDAAAVPVNDYDLTYKIPRPFTGGTPAAYFSAPQYTGNVVWTAGVQPLSGLFGANTAYTATVTLTAASGYTFAGVGANAFTYNGVPTISNSAASGAVTIMFPATTGVTAIPVTDLDLTTKIPAPVRGAIPLTYISTSGQYTGNVAWSVTGGGHALNGLFEAGTAYTATVTLTAASGYTFDGVGANAFICNGVTTLSNSAGSGVVSIVFPATEPNQTTVIPSVDLTSVLLAPIAFVPTVTVINTGTYRGTVVWTTSAGNGPVQAFETGTVYRATVTLYPAAGYSFPAALPVTHSGSSGGIAAFTGEPRQGTITFPVTGTFSNFSGPFSGSSLNPADSAIDLIQAAKAAEHPFLYLQLGPRAAETVNISASDQDIGTSTDGLVLNTTTSPPGVTIDGGKRTIELAQAGTLITVGAGVTLTLRNITIIGASGNTAPLVNEVDGGRVIYETGVSTFNKTTLQTSSSLSNSKTKGGSGIDLIRAAYDSAPNDLLTVTLEPGTEVVSLDDTADIGTGLVLNSGNSPTQVTIDGSGRTIQLDGNTSGSIITVGAGVTLTLQNITFKGKAGNNAPLIKVNGGTLILGEGAELTDSSLYGVELDGGAFMMTGGSVSNSASTGVRVITGAFSMSGGSVSDNANNGVSLGTAGSTFSMSGGSVSRNKNYGVLVGPGAGFFMTGGTISGNTGAAAGGVVLNQGGGTFTKTGGTIYGGNEAGTDAGGPLANTALWGTGHAVGGEKTRSTTAGPGDYLDSTKTGTEGGWE